MALVRKNIQMSEQVAQWYEKKSKDMGVSQSALMTIALQQFIDQDRAMSLMDNMKQMLVDLKKMKQEQPKID